MVGIDLDAARERRLAAAAEKAFLAKAEYTVGEEPLIFGGTTVAMLPAELPLAVWEPLIGIPYLPLLLRSLVEAAQTQGDEQSEAASLIVDVLGSEPSLPSDLLAAAAEMGRRLLGHDGFARLMEQRPSHPDIFELVRAVWAKYFPGGSLGELMGPSGSPSGAGTTSKPTSSGTTISTPAVSGDGPVTLDSSGPGAS
ncbi:hypothetical protein ACIQI7_09090 [Kitasatospora sp. NPDC092039]|uniref:hypothetical protein n=1 Tax=Kitasatospora sp. NPDC092039 TaxID=3364086 RepID=UPI00382C0D6A